MAYTFLKAKGANIGQSICEDSQLDIARHIMNLADENNTALLLPEDVVATPSIDGNGEEVNVFDKYSVEDTFETQVMPSNDIPNGWQGMDIGPNTRQKFANLVSQSKTILWNGPVGVFEYTMLEKGTQAIAAALKQLTEKGGTTIVGGGDSVAAIEKFGFEKSQFTHVSTGGGASLEFLEGKILPGVDCLDKKEDEGEQIEIKPTKSFKEELESLK